MRAANEELAAGDGVTLLLRRWTPTTPVASVVIVHGAADHSGRWEHVGDFLAEAGFEVHAYDMRGHGRSEGRPMYVSHFDEFLDDLEIVLARAAESGVPTVIYGHSLGGLISTAYGVSGRRQPDRFVLSAPALHSTTPRFLRAVAAVLGGLLPKVTAPTVIKKEQLSRDPAIGDAYFDDPRVHSKGTLRMGKEVFRVMAETKAALDRLKTPALVFHGSDDELVPPGVSEPFAALPNVERKVFEGLRHELHNEPEGDDVLGFVVEWLRRQFEAAA